MESISILLGDVFNFLTKIISTLQKEGIDVSKCELDHICYRVESNEKYEEYKQKLSALGELLTETEINGRLISTYKLKEPIEFKGRKIFCVELPSPKEGVHYPEGLEHAEFVIKDSFEDFMSKHPNVRFDTKDISKPINPDISITYKGFSVKFHHKPLEYVIKYEQ